MMHNKGEPAGSPLLFKRTISVVMPMSYNRTRPQLSVIVPTLNEEDGLGELFDSLAGQRGLVFEVIFSDGGSTDATLDRVKQLACLHGLDLQVVEGEKGRGRQLNSGARVARAETLLFLHADSRFASDSALCRSLAFLDRAIEDGGRDAVAARFALRFSRTDAKGSRGYAFYEAKARLNRSECIHGDQGFLLRKSFFDRVGPFDAALGFLEDCRLAEKIGHQGKWLLLPAEIWTSARRFEVEGLGRRQILNALIMNFNAAGWDQFFAALPSVYRSQEAAGRLDLRPVFLAIRGLLGRLPRQERFRLWYATGSYVRENAWQVVFALLFFLRGCGCDISEQKGAQLLDRFDRRFDALTDHPPGCLLTASVVWVWFHGACGWLSLRSALAQIAARVKSLGGCFLP